MKVLHIINSLDIGGAELLLSNSITAFIQQYPQVQHYLVTLYSDPFAPNELKHDIPFLDLKANSELFFLKSFTLKKWIKKNKIDIVHSHLFEATILSRISLPKSTQLVSTYHNGFHTKKSVFFSRKRLFLDKLTFKKKNYTVFVSRTVKQQITESIDMPNCKVIYNFPDERFTNKYIFNQKNTLKLVSIGGLKEVKKFDLAIKVLSSIKEYPVSLDIYGEGHLRDELQQMINKLNTNVRLMGNTSITSELLAGYDIFLMTSESEGMSIALLEALATGMPCILNSIPELYETAQNAAIYYDFNSENSLKENIIKCFHNKQILINLSENAKDVSSGYSSRRYVTSLFSLYNQIINDSAN